MPLDVLTVQHHEDSPAGLVGEAIEAGGGRLVIVRGDLGEALPEDPQGFAGLLLLGGAMSATDDEDYPHFPALLELIRAFLNQGRPVLGLCLGAQLLARAHGANVAPMAEDAFGFRRLRLSAAGRRDPLLAGAEPEPVLMQYHEDAFELPPAAELLATSDYCPNQAIRIGRLGYGFQCHLEVTAGIARLWAELRAGQLGVDPELLRRRVESGLDRHLPAAEHLGRTVGARWFRLVQTQHAAAA